MQKIRRMFPGGNTSEGFISFHDNIISQDKNMLYILKGMPGGGKSSMMNSIADRILKKGYSVEYHHCPSDPESIDGINIIELGIGMVDGTPPHSIDPTYPGLTDKIIDLSQFIDSDIVKSKSEDIIEAKKKNKTSYRKAFNYMKAAEIIYNEIWEENQGNLDTRKANRESQILIEEIFMRKENPIGDGGFGERYLFTRAVTPEGIIDYTETILEWVSNIYYISGDIGTGKSNLLNKILEESRIRNYHIEIYYNPLIPRRIESLFIKELDTIITSNKKAEDFQSTKLDLNKYLDSKRINQEEYRIYNHLLDQAIKSLNGAKDNHFILESAYKDANDYEGISNLREEIFNEILESIEG